MENTIGSRRTYKTTYDFGCVWNGDTVMPHVHGDFIGEMMIDQSLIFVGSTLLLHTQTPQKKMLTVNTHHQQIDETLPQKLLAQPVVV